MKKYRTVVESSLFAQDWPDVWTDDEYSDFIEYIASNPEAGDTIKESGGCRKVRWSRPGSGKSSGVRVIYTLRLQSGKVMLLVIYPKSARASISAKQLKAIAKVFANATD